ncbi:MAG TPA: DNA ligase D, partial [Longimicrobiaceae bacterium]|nr:DNA ligase D [Longimicrobiaceae bacterium]
AQGGLRVAPRTGTRMQNGRASATAGARPAALPDTLLPQLATLVDRAPAGDDWLHEVKLDGYRLVCIAQGGTARLLTRKGNDWTPRFPALASALARLGDVVVDGELVVLKDDGITSFQALQAELAADREARLTFYAFDLMFADGRDLRDRPLVERKARLAELIAALPAARRGAPGVRYSDHVLGSGDAFHAQACRWGLEGIISKRADAPYQSRRTRDWVKVKCMQRQELVVGGFTAPRGGRVGLGALLVGYYDDEGRFVYAGKVGTGFDDALLRTLTARLAKEEVAASPFADLRRMGDARWVAPTMVVEVSFAEWTDDGHLRHPAFQGIREDKDATEVRREMPATSDSTPAPAADRTRRNGPQKPPVPLPRSAAPRRPARARTGDAVTIAGVTLSNPGRVLWPEPGFTKADLARYYAAVAPWILPQVADRPLTLVRCPGGVAAPCFYQKHADDSFPASIGRVAVEEGGEVRPYTYVHDVAGLVSFAQMGVLELHAWGARRDRIERPDRVVIDLDPATDVPWARVVHAAFEIRERLLDVGLESWVKTTGGKGLHVVVPIARRSTWDEAKAFSRALCEDVAAGHPGWYVLTSTLAKRKGRIFLDYLRNGRGATAICAYGVRARPGGTVSVPLRWDELTPATDPGKLTIATVPRRLAALRGDPWEGMADVKQALTRTLMRHLGAAA